MSTGTVISLIVALAALGISAASLWHSALRPAAIELDYLAEGLRVSGGGGNSVPDFAVVEILFSAVNLGARAGLVKRVEILSVTSPGAVEFAEGYEGPNRAAHADVGIDGSPSTFPRTMQSGDVWAVRIFFSPKGPFRTEAGTTRLESISPPPSEHFVAMLQRLQGVNVVVRCSYRRSGGRFQRREATEEANVSLPAQVFRSAAGRYWRGIDRNDLADAVDPI